VVCNLGCCIFGFLGYDGSFVDNTFVLRCIFISKIMAERNASAYYFHAKSLERHKMGSTKPCSQKTGLVNSLGTTPWYSVEKPNFGATVA
jgi:hypothetical protein